MTRRIALAILLSCWAMLLVACAVAYWSTRQTLLAELDDSIVSRAVSLPQLAGTAGSSPEGALPEGDRYLIRNQMGRTVARPATAAADMRKAHVLDRRFVPVAEGSRMRSLTLSIGSPSAEGGPVTVIYSSPAEDFDHVLGSLAIALGAAVVVGGVVASWVAVKVSRTALRPLKQTADAIGEIDERRLDRRIDPKTLPPELVPMAERLNQMLERLEHGFSQRRQFLADAAHELRTPVAAMMTSLEVSLRRPRELDDMLGTMRDCLSDARLLRGLVQSLMEHACGDNGANATLEDTDIAGLLGECADQAQTWARARQVELRRNIPQEFRMMTQPRRLRSIVSNLLGNAIEYNHPGGTVDLQGNIQDNALELIVRDTGKGIAAEHLPHVFEPFYRGDSVRAIDGEHRGMGLFLVHSHVEALGGRCQVESEIGLGTTFRIWVPEKHMSLDNNDLAIKNDHFNMAMKGR